jgi:hypothetical protein
MTRPTFSGQQCEFISRLLSNPPFSSVTLSLNIICTCVVFGCCSGTYSGSLSRTWTFTSNANLGAFQFNISENCCISPPFNAVGNSQVNVPDGTITGVTSCQTSPNYCEPSYTESGPGCFVGWNISSNVTTNTYTLSASVSMPNGGGSNCGASSGVTICYANPCSPGVFSLTNIAPGALIGAHSITYTSPDGTENWTWVMTIS